MKKQTLLIITIFSAATLTAILRSVSFINPFGVMQTDRPMNKAEIIRAVRLSIAAEYEAVQLYTQIAESTNDPVVKKVMIHVADEERVHAGEFLRLLKHLDPEEEKYYQTGYKEVEEEIEEIKAKDLQ